MVIPPDDHLLRALSLHFRSIAIKERERVKQFKSYIFSIVEPIQAEFEADLSRIARLKNELQINQKGEARTESLESYTSKNVLSQLSPADRFLLKKAYRYAARLAHPDGGGSGEDFHAVHQAYLQGDLTSLQEYALSRHKSILEQYVHWSVEKDRPSVDLETFKQNAEFQIARLVLRGKPDQARKAMRMVIQSLESSLLKENYGNQKTPTQSSPS